MEEGSSKRVQDLVARSGGGEGGASVEKTAPAPAVARKTVRMSEICDFIPCAQDVGGDGTSRISISSLCFFHVHFI
jgi:hypothetical protein